MKVTVSWLREFVDFDLGVESLCRGLTFLGQEVESVYSERDSAEAESLLKLSADEGFELDDTVLDLEITPNRPDCLSVVGIAREVSLLVDKPLRLRKVKLAEAGRPVEDAATLEVRETEACPRYIGRVITGITVGESPVWLKRRLLAVGLRPLNAVVDLSNYIMLETGQPTHCFDLDKLLNKAVVVRFARRGERIVTLDEVERELYPDMLVIADSERPVAIAGVMGGVNTAISSSTTSVFLECAYFDPPLIRRASRRLGLSTEASYRFERGADIGALEKVSRFAASQIAELCGGSILAGSIESYPVPYRPQSVRFRPERVNRVLGTKIEPHAMEKILLTLGFGIGKDADVKRSEQMWVEPPSFRPDVSREEDLIEEVARAYGYDRIPAELPKVRLFTGRLNPDVQLMRRIKQSLKSLGLCEVWTLSLVGDGLLDRCHIPQDDPLRAGVRLMNPLSSDQDMLRTFMLPGVLTCASHNARHKELDHWLFGLGNVFIDRGEMTPEERMHVCIVGCGDPLPFNWARGKGNGSFYHMKGIVERMLEDLHLPSAKIEPHELPFAERDVGFSVRVGSEPVGFLGQLGADVAESFDLSRDCYFAELDLHVLKDLTALPRKYRRYSVFPAVVLDLAVTLPRETQSGEAEAIIREVGGELVESVTLFDRYQGKQIPSDRVSLAYSIKYRSSDRTLTVEEAFQRHQKIIEELSRRLGGKLRE